MSNSRNNKYIAISGDIINSKASENRNELQIKLKSTLALINDKYNDDIVVDFAIIYGDGLQGLLKITDSTMDIISDIELEMYPAKLRFGIGVGNISTNIGSNTYEIDGECLHFARSMVDEIVKNKSKHRISKTNIMLFSGSENIKRDRLLNTVLSLAYVIKKDWTKKQWEIIYNYVAMNMNQTNTAIKLGVNKSSISKSLSASNYLAYKSAMDIVSNYLYIGG